MNHPNRTGGDLMATTETKGTTTVTLTGDDLERMGDLADALRDGREAEEESDDAADGQLFDAPSQLSFNLGTGRRDSPDFATVKVAGQLSVDLDLKYAQTVWVRVTGRDGEVISEGTATLGYPAFKDHFDKYGSKTVERIHTATLD